MIAHEVLRAPAHLELRTPFSALSLGGFRAVAPRIQFCAGKNLEFAGVCNLMLVLAVGCGMRSGQTAG